MNPFVKIFSLKFTGFGQVGPWCDVVFFQLLWRPCYKCLCVTCVALHWLQNVKKHMDIQGRKISPPKKIGESKGAKNHSGEKIGGGIAQFSSLKSDNIKLVTNC